MTSAQVSVFGPDVAAQFERLEEEDRFWTEHFPRYLETCAGQIVAIRGSELVAVEASREALDRAIARAGIDPKDVSTKYIGRPQEAFLY